MDNKRITPFIIVSTLTALAALCALANGGCKFDRRPSAQQSAAEWAHEVGIETDTIVCNNLDTDDDGYVSCTFNRAGEIRTFECGYQGLFYRTEGCREPKASVRVHNHNYGSEE